MGRSFVSALKNFLSAGLAIAAVFVAGLASAFTRDVLRGRNYSDVGVPMYEHNGIAILAGLFVFAVVLFGCLYALQRTLSRNFPWFPYLIALITAIGFSPILIFILFG